MEFISQAVTVLQTLVIALGAGLAVWGVVNLMEGYGNDNPGAKSQGIKQLMAGGGVVLIGMTLIPLLSGLFSTSAAVVTFDPRVIASNISNFFTAPSSAATPNIVMTSFSSMPLAA